jgi:hypothetical protein
MTSFPLYNVILSETENMNNVTVSDKEQLCENIKNMDAEGFELCYALIKCYSQQFHKDNTSPPFHPKKSKIGYKFDIDDIPDRLICILLQFTNKHVEKLREDSVRFGTASS